MRTITAALIAYLHADTTLRTLAPRGAWLDIAPPVEKGRPWTPVVLVALSRAPLEEDMCRTVARRFSLLVAVEGEQSQVGAVRAAAARLDDLLHDVSWTATGWAITRSAFVDVREVAYVEDDARRSAVIGTLEVAAERAA